MFTKIKQPALWSSLLQDLHSLELYFMPPSFLDINTIIHEKLEKKYIYSAFSKKQWILKFE